MQSQQEGGFSAGPLLGIEWGSTGLDGQCSGDWSFRGVHRESFVFWVEGTPAPGGPQNGYVATMFSDKPIDDIRSDISGHCKDPDRCLFVGAADRALLYDLPFDASAAPGESDHVDLPIELLGHASAATTGFLFSVNEAAADNRFSYFRAPEPLTTQAFIGLNNQVYPIDAGDVFDFTQIDNSGVESFLLYGIDDALLPTTFGIGFTGQGLGVMDVVPLDVVPEPSGWGLLAMALPWIIARSRLVRQNQ